MSTIFGVCPGQPACNGDTVDDGMHCDHWFAYGPCCRCGEGTDATLASSVDGTEDDR
jgi:hypothetical protein